MKFKIEIVLADHGARFHDGYTVRDGNGEYYRRWFDCGAAFGHYMTVNEEIASECSFGTLQHVLPELYRTLGITTGDKLILVAV